MKKFSKYMVVMRHWLLLMHFSTELYWQSLQCTFCLYFIVYQTIQKLFQSTFLPLTDETWIGIYTLKDCYPVQEIFTKNYSVLFSTRFFDIELGIKDPSVFIPPSTCQAAQMEWASEDCPLWVPEYRKNHLGNREPAVPSQKELKLGEENLHWK